MALIVQKFGGSSVADLARIRNVAQRVARTVDAGNQVVVVLSAMGDTTDDLIAMAKEITPHPSEREMDMLMTTGEQQSVALLAITLQTMGYKAVSLTGEQAGIRTDRVYSRAKIISIDSVRLERELAGGKIVVVTGFQGIDSLGEIHTLGRGGSDTSGVALAIGLNADFCEIYTDVDGVYTADPRIVPEAHKLPEISFDEMLEMSSLGAGVLQPRSVEMAKTFNMPVCVRSSFNDNEGTMVKEEVEMKQLEQEVLVSGVAYDDDLVKVTVYGVPDRPGIASVLFCALADAKVNVDMIIQSGHKNGKNDISFTTSKEADGKLEEVLEPVIAELGADNFTLETDVAKVSIVGAGMITNPGVAARMFKCLYENGFNIEMISTSEIKVSCILKKEGAKDAVRKLHEYFGL
ncbi:MAG TPA: aspartate kinase [Candidatus Avidehalobacter gallistercoris]|uniref:Aspartokinase n=1 Tax=Candidatus Avidehalobacter gallistercoris TaxID=2840694 RepID=A0A9D1HLZ5_9FIRM|nr:aspartate kinase [Candidatus Avidehalobacter gallistercoris]